MAFPSRQIASFSHQIPAEFLFEQADNVRVHTSASSLETAFAAPFGSPGVTAYNVFDGKRHLRTVTKPLLSQLRERSANWAILEYNPSAPLQPTVQPSNSIGCTHNNSGCFTISGRMSSSHFRGQNCPSIVRRPSKTGRLSGHCRALSGTSEILRRRLPATQGDDPTINCGYGPKPIRTADSVHPGNR